MSARLKENLLANNARSRAGGAQATVFLQPSCETCAATAPAATVAAPSVASVYAPELRQPSFTRTPVGKDPRSRPKRSTVSAASGGTETSRFMDFVDLLASKSDVEQQQIVMLALQEANARRTDSARTKASNSSGMRRVVSADELRRGGCARPLSVGDTSQFFLASGDTSRLAMQRRRMRAANTLWDAQLSSDVHRNSPKIRSEERRKAELRRLFVANSAARTLQSAWRGWQHRRLCRFLRARDARHKRLSWLWHVEHMRYFFHWRAAALCIQAAWRSYWALHGCSPAQHESRALNGSLGAHSASDEREQGVSLEEDLKFQARSAFDADVTRQSQQRRGVRWAENLTEVREYAKADPGSP